MKLWKRLCAVVLSAALLAGVSITGAGACTSLYVGSELTQNGSTYFGRGEDIGEHYDKVFQVIDAADHEEGEVYEDAYGFTMPWPAHTYRYTYVRDSLEYGENITDDDDNVLIPAYAQAGINELGVSVTATVSTIYDNDFLDGFDAPEERGICEISIAGVILQEATSARHGVEILAAVLDEYGAGDDYGYYNSILIGDTEEVWNFQIVSAHNYVAVRLPADKVSINPNIVTMGEVDVSDEENVVASEGLISLPLEKGFLVSSQYDPENYSGEAITKINIRETYGTDDGDGQYTRYFQGVNYLNPELFKTLDTETLDGDGKMGSAELGGPISYLFQPASSLSTYEVLRFFATRGEGMGVYDSNNADTDVWAIGNEHQAEVHVFEIRSDSGLPAELATVEWLAMNRSEFSVYLPFYSALLTDTSEVYQCEWTNDDGEDWNYYNPDEDMELFGDLVNEPSALPENSIFWAFSALNDLCDNDRVRYGAAVKEFWADYQQALIDQQADVDAYMRKLYNADPAKAEEAATELGKAIAEETFAYAWQLLEELWDFIQNEEETPSAVFEVSAELAGVQPAYASTAKSIAAELLPGSSNSGSSAANRGPSVSSGSSASDTGDKNTEPDDSANSTVDQPAMSFVDVPGDSWAYDAIAYVYENGLFDGISDGVFGFEAPMTRQQAWTVLAGLNGNAPAGADEIRAWAAATLDDGGDPTGVLTREEFVALLWSYAGSPASAQDLSGYTDADAVADDAETAMRWAVEKGILVGTSATTLSPADAATRAQIAVILAGYCQDAEG